jgi:hypothetical protein
MIYCWRHMREKETSKKALRFAQLRNDFSDTLRDKNKESIIQGLNARFNFNQQQQKLQVQEAENTLLRKQKNLITIYYNFKFAADNQPARNCDSGIP